MNVLFETVVVAFCILALCVAAALLIHLIIEAFVWVTFEIKDRWRWWRHERNEEKLRRARKPLTIDDLMVLDSVFVGTYGDLKKNPELLAVVEARWKEQGQEVAKTFAQGYGAISTFTTGSNNTCIGYYAGASLTEASEVTRLEGGWPASKPDCAR